MLEHKDAAGILIKVGDKVVCQTVAGIWEVCQLDAEAYNIISLHKNVKGVMRYRDVYTFHCNVNNHSRMIAGYEADAKG